MKKKQEKNMADKNTFFRTDIARSKNIRVDKNSDVISGFAVVTKGITHDERGEFDDAALDRVVDLGNKSRVGIKSRFGHPNMSSTALGTFLGRVKNFKRDGDIVRADLHIDKTAHSTPDGDLASYVTNLAESDPNAFGSSMVIYWDEESREEKDANGNQLPPFIRVKDLFSVDVVDDPAANNGLFGMPFFSESVKPSAEMTAFLDRFLQEPDAVGSVIAFLERYRSNEKAVKTVLKKKEVDKMFEELTVEKLKEQRADIFDAVRKQGVEEGVKQGASEGQKLERERTVEILRKAETFKDMGSAALEAVEQGFSVEQATIKFQEKQLEGLKASSAKGVGPDNPEDSQDPAKKSHLERAKEYKEKHNCSMTEALQKTAVKRQQ
ncbi:MAG: hypothetical protein V1909_00350 [Candidatus Micrarchaeota archaeon]